MTASDPAEHRSLLPCLIKGSLFERWGHAVVRGKILTYYLEGSQI